MPPKGKKNKGGTGKPKLEEAPQTLAQDSAYCTSDGCIQMENKALKASQEARKADEKLKEDAKPPGDTPTGGESSTSAQEAVSKSVESDALKNATDSESSKQVKLPIRPAFGTNGKPVNLLANYFPMIVNKPEKVIHQYSMEIRDKAHAASLTPPKKARQIVELLLQSHLKGCIVATDFRSNLISLGQLPGVADKTPKVFSIPYQGNKEDGPSAQSLQNPCQVRIVFARTVDFTEVLNQVKSVHKSAGVERDTTPEVIQAFNILIGHYAKASHDLVSTKKNDYFPLDPTRENRRLLAGKLMAVRGILASVRPATQRVILNTQIRNMPFYESGRLDQLLGNINWSSDAEKRTWEKCLNKTSIQVTHIERKKSAGEVIPRFKSILGFANPGDGNKDTHFVQVRFFGAGPKDVRFRINSDTSKQSRWITVFDFFKSEYGRNLIPTLPILNVGTKDMPTYMPMDVCILRPGQAAKAKLTGEQTSDMIRFAVRPPRDNVASIQSDARKILGLDSPNGLLGSFGVSVIPKLIKTQGRQLDRPMLMYRDQKNLSKPVSTTKGSWNLRDQKFQKVYATATAPAKWAVLVVSEIKTQGGLANAGTFTKRINTFATNLRNMGVALTPGRPIYEAAIARRDVKPPGTEDAIDEEIKKICSDKPKILFVIFNQGKDAPTATYNKVKWLCDVKYGLRNVCVLWENSLAKEAPINSTEMSP